ncbi:ATP-binding protein [Alicyclobacillus sp. SO9]|uniref:AAA family ATPase n=1 Tax=Alicyclobacillus sp. SO9 TaxID=2665646 RepID=UPI0018E8940D|nr:ATP-binding protein [Alicyclobacillus sp. SO9]QQE78389.1 AAA family ATPase [Alicyclobacillus sp. SO9]
MRIKELELNGWRSFSDTEGVHLRDLKRINLIIGPNNTGKSNLFKYLYHLREITFRHFKDKVDQHQISSPFDNYGSLNSIPEAFSIQNTWKFDGCEIVSKIALDELPHVWSGREPTLHRSVVPIVLQARHNCSSKLSCLSVLYGNIPLLEEFKATDGGTPKLLNPDTMEYENPKEGMQYPNDTYDYWLAFLHSLVFVDPVRHFARSSWDAGESDFDGSDIVRQIIEIRNHQDDEWADFKEMLERWLKSILDEPMFQLDPKDSELRFYITRGGKRISADLSHLGTGVAQMIMLLAYLFLNRDKSLNVFIEEPESNLHPEAVIQLVRVIEQNFPNHCMFISTHSSVLVDQVNDGWSVYRVSRKEDKYTTISPCHEVVQKFRLLDELGIRPSQLLQSNVVIWVEGPSDRTYIKRWITCRSSELIEGKHYTFMMYGGSNLSSYDFLGEEEYIDILKTSRYAVVVCDSDLDSEHESLKQRVQRLQTHLNQSATETGAQLSDYVKLWITQGREIENYIPGDILYKVMFGEEMSRHYLEINGERKDLSLISDFDFLFGQFDSFDEICAAQYTFADGTCLDTTGHKKIASDLASKKTKTAKLVSDHWTEESYVAHDLSDKIEELITFIKRANLLEERTDTNMSNTQLEKVTT